MKERNDKQTPIQLLAAVIIITFASEMLIMLLLPLIPPASPLVHGLLDSSLLVILIFPGLYLFSFRPLISELAELDLAQKELRKAHDELEKRVEERTAELLESNTLLRQEIIVRNRTQEELCESEKKLRSLSFRLMDAQEAERTRISRELHDELGQSLTLLKLQFQTNKKKLREDQQELREGCDESLRYMDRVIDNIRRLSHELSPCILEDLGLSAALRKLINDFAKHSGVKITAAIEEIDHLFPRGSHIIVYRIFQEALTNITKHAGAKNVSIILKKENRSAVFFVEDDGKGFDMSRLEAEPLESEPLEAKPLEAETRSDSGLGLATMSERARMLGGSLSISSEPGKGTRIVLTLPVEPASETQQPPAVSA
ncbi:MAG: sensor histidine kinase [Candidatus Lindowbacteria bacterium]|nr:sensor histidine kinase [Candidatus Lindowbacteria bacterium]